MRLFEISDEEQGVSEFFKTISIDCAPFFKEMGGLKNIQNNPLFRGIKKSIDTAIKTDINQNRLPVDTPEAIHEEFVEAFSQAGFKANRNNSMFCTGSLEQAENYGIPYIIFPVGEYDITWSPDVIDMYTSAFYTMLAERGNLRIDFKSAKEFLEFQGFTDTYFDDENDQEIYINNFMYNLGEKINEFWPNILSEANLTFYDLSSFLKKEYKSSNIFQAIKSKCEIMVSCKSAYVIRKAFFKKFGDYVAS